MYYNFGYIARTQGSGTLSGSIVLDGVHPQFRINSTILSYPSRGEVYDKMGSTTGWTWGGVTEPCWDVPLLGTDIFLLCQARVESGAAASGDSGGPVFSLQHHPHEVAFAGILWAGTNISGGSYFVFSHVGGITQDLGYPSVH
jgi:hypothetical protein